MYLTRERNDTVDTRLRGFSDKTKLVEVVVTRA